MGHDARSVAHDLGLILQLPALLALAVLPVALFSGDSHAIAPLVGVAAVSGTAGFALMRRFRDEHTSHAWPAVEVVALGWLVLAGVAALLLWLIAFGAADDTPDRLFRDPGNAAFEALSGATATGLSMADGVESGLSRTVQWLRSLLQWLGGVGVVLFAIGFTHTASNVRALYEAEGRNDDLGGSVRVTVRRTLGIYLGLTIAAVLALLPTDHTPWQALNHGVTTMATGGFTVTDESIGAYGVGTAMVTLPFMVLGSLTFVAHHVLFVQRDPGRFWRLTPVRVHVGMLVAGGVVALVVASVVAQPDTFTAVYQWVSASTTTGLTVETSQRQWPAPLLLLVVVGMVVGAPSGSTGGGIKQDRVTWLVKQAFARRRGPRQGDVRWDGELVDADARRRAVTHAGAIVGLWSATLAIGVVALSAVTDAPVLDVLFDAASALSNVGLDADVVDARLSGPAKTILMALMYLGRLELLAALTLAAQHEHAT
ncbi:TrkH family potassium uptake protein [Egicoccus sp. AB-alg6-2]|uniref:TrkH family potassium uptake protein n=1 Tax=Egicoccus sp. AB-alg6-2 TaxID=3242692 RepID=UPI00359CC214